MARTTITLNIDIWKAGLKRAKALGYKSFSAYCEYLVDYDVRERPSHVTVRQEQGQQKKAAKKSAA